MKFFACIFALVVVLGVASAGFIRSGWSSPHAYSSPVVSRVVVSPSYHGYGGYRGHGGYGGYGGYSGYGGYGGYGSYGGHGGYGGWSSGYRSGWW